MSGRRGLYLVLLVLLVGALSVFPGDDDPEVSFSAVLEVWGDLLRDADQFGLKLTRVSDQDEMKIGKELSDAVKTWAREDRKSEAYVSAVGQALLPHIKRKGIEYEFHVVQADQVINAFALPGGRIYVTTGMLKFLESEAELAAILGHEIAHVDLRHCIEHYQFELTLRKVGAGVVGQVAEIARRLVAVEYNKYQEFEADAYGLRLSIETGYDPSAGAAVFDRMMRKFGEARASKAQTPVGEIAQALGNALVSYFRSHPPSVERAQRLKRLVEKNRERLSGHVVYVGVENYSEKTPRTRKEFQRDRRRLYGSPQEAAAQGNPDAQFEVGMMYLEGQGVGQSNVEALKWLRKSAEQEHRSAEYALGGMYELGLGVSQDPNRAIHWYMAASAHGHPAAPEAVARLLGALPAQGSR